MDSSRRKSPSSIERENAELRRAISLLHRVSTLVRESPELEPTCYAVLTGVTAGVGLGFNRAMLFLVDADERRVLRGVAAVGPTDREEADRVWKSIASLAPDLHALYEAGLRQRENPGLLDRLVRSTVVPVDGDSPVALALRQAKRTRGEATDDLNGLLHLPTAIATPLRGKESLAGVLCADNRFTGSLPDTVTDLVLTMVADHAGRAIESAHHFEDVARRARTDALTGLGHHGAMMEAVAAEVARAHAGSGQVGLVILDLDDFKRVNDNLGHLAGDALLAGVSARLRSEVRGPETPFRYGGEEFAVLLRDPEPGTLLAVGERIRKAVGERPYALGGGRSASITCSVGVAALDEENRGDARALIAAADAALLRAKRNGKNRVERYQERHGGHPV